MGVRIEDPGDLRSGLKKALDHSGPALLDVVTDPNALSLPSHITAGQVEGFALTMSKLVLSGHIDEVVDTVEANIRHIQGDPDNCRCCRLFLSIACIRSKWGQACWMA